MRSTGRVSDSNTAANRHGTVVCHANHRIHPDSTSNGDRAWGDTNRRLSTGNDNTTGDPRTIALDVTLSARNTLRSTLSHDQWNRDR